MEAVHDIAKIKGENAALRNENKFLRELLTKQLNILPVSNSVCPECNGDGQTYGVMGFSTCKLCNGKGCGKCFITNCGMKSWGLNGRTFQPTTKVT